MMDLSKLSVVADDFILQKNNEQTVHILASGRSISQLNIQKIQNNPTIFVNGSIQLFGKNQFNKATAYVISDHRFIEHNTELLKQYYDGQCPLFITQSVLNNLKKLEPKYLNKIMSNIHLIYDFRKPISTKKQTLLDKITRKLQKTPFNGDFIQFKSNTKKPSIGVSTNIRHGFVEAGTVVYVATQLAFTMGFNRIYVHGMDLLNANQPRFYENKNNHAPCKLDQAIENRIVPSFNFLADEYHKHGVKVYNGSPISKDLFKNLPYSNQYLLNH